MTPPKRPPVRLAVLTSGGGSNLAALIAAIERGDLAARIVLVISSHPEVQSLQRARAAGIPAHCINAKTSTDPATEIDRLLSEHVADVVILAGYLKKLAMAVVTKFVGRTLNIHPAPLPRFGGPGMYGHRVHEAVLSAGVSYSGPTVHRVTEEYDEGEVLAHQAVAVLPNDTPHTLAARVLSAEHDLYWRVIQAQFGDGQAPPIGG